MRNWKQIASDVLLVVIAFAIAFVIMLMTAAIAQAQDAPAAIVTLDSYAWYDKDRDGYFSDGDVPAAHVPINCWVGGQYVEMETDGDGFDWTVVAAAQEGGTLDCYIVHEWQDKTWTARLTASGLENGYIYEIDYPMQAQVDIFLAIVVGRPMATATGVNP